MSNKEVVFQILNIVAASGYAFKCPANAEWRLRAKVSCSSKDKYVCLFHLLEKKYQDDCSKSELSSIGSNLVFQPLLNIAECNIGRFQPIVFTTYGNSECIMLKSKCDDEGQIIHSPGSPNTDTACRCDYTKGYVFITSPTNMCFCIPSEEDCSCFRVPRAKLSPDNLLYSWSINSLIERRTNLFYIFISLYLSTLRVIDKKQVEMIKIELVDCRLVLYCS